MYTHIHIYIYIYIYIYASGVIRDCHKELTVNILVSGWSPRLPARPRRAPGGGAGVKKSLE